MDKMFQKFLRSGLDLSAVGIERREEQSLYFCTPKGASVFGWAGVDGIHFCFIRGFGNMVFAVSPMNSAPDFVHPIAYNFEEFLRLILACGDAAGPEQAWQWDETQFERFLRDNPPTEEQQCVLSDLGEKLKLRPMERPWHYIKELQTSFDYSKIKYTEEFYDMDLNPETEQAPPEWKVYFDGKFWGYRGRDRAGTEIPLDSRFEWAGHVWQIPAAYACSKGLVVDFCMRADGKELRQYMERWNLDPEHDSGENLTRIQEMQIERENPLLLDFDPQLLCNGKVLHTAQGCGIAFNPCVPAAYWDRETQWVMEHYALDPAYGWMIFRYAFPWATKRRPTVKTLSVTMVQSPQTVPGMQFTAHAPGEVFHGTHPVSGEKYTLTVQALERQTVPEGAFASKDWLYPTHYTAMTYMLSPEPTEQVFLMDSDGGDKPLRLFAPKDRFAPNAENCVGIIGGADAPTAFVLNQSTEQVHTACSALHFEPMTCDVEWNLIFTVQEYADSTISLL